MQKTQAPKDKSGTRPRPERVRFLNVIYFVDSHRTRSLKFTLKTAAFSVTLLLALLSWSFIASGLLYREYSINSELRVHSRKLLGAIFTYQTRYDEVYELAYPGDHQSLAAKSSVSNEDKALKTEDNDLDGLDTSDAPSIKTGENMAAVSQASEATPKEKVVSHAPRPAETKAEVPIAIENFSEEMQDSTLIVRFALKNLATPNKTSGRVNAQASFTDDNKQVTAIEMRPGEADDDQGSEGADPSSDQHFNIRYYKNKVFRFDPPEGVKGEFTAVVVTLKDEKGHTKDFRFAIKPKKAPVVEATPTEDSELEEAKGPFAKASSEP